MGALYCSNIVLFIESQDDIEKRQRGIDVYKAMDGTEAGFLKVLVSHELGSS